MSPPAGPRLPPPLPPPRLRIQGVIFGVDPGFANCGWGVVLAQPLLAPKALAFGCITTPEGTPLHQRVDQVLGELLALIRQHKPQVIAAEQWVPYAGHERVTVGTNTLRICGGVRALATALGLPCHEYDAVTLKGTIAGDRQASKLDVQRAVQKALSLAKLPRPDHAADALAAALTVARLGPPDERPLAPVLAFARPARRSRRTRAA